MGISATTRLRDEARTEGRRRLDDNDVFCIDFRPFGHCHIYPTCTRSAINRQTYEGL